MSLSSAWNAKRAMGNEPKDSTRRVEQRKRFTWEIAALRAFYRFAGKMKKLLPLNVGGKNLSLPRGTVGKRFTKSRSRILENKKAAGAGKIPEDDAHFVRTRAILELAYASGLRLAELKKPAARTNFTWMRVFHQCDWQR